MWGAIKSIATGPVVSRVIGGILAAGAGLAAKKGISIDPQALDSLATAITLVVYGVSHKAIEKEK